MCIPSNFSIFFDTISLGGWSALGTRGLVGSSNMESPHDLATSGKIGKLVGKVIVTKRQNSSSSLIASSCRVVGSGGFCAWGPVISSCCAMGSRGFCAWRPVASSCWMVGSGGFCAWGPVAFSYHAVGSRARKLIVMIINLAMTWPFLVMTTWIE